MSDGNSESDEASAIARTPVWFVALFAALTIFLGLPGQDGEREPAPTLLALAVGLLVVWTIHLGASVWASRRWGSGGFAADLRLRIVPRDLAVGVAAGLFTSIVLVRVVYLLLTLADLIDADDLERLSEPAERVAELASGPRFLVLIALVGLGAPIAEEIYFRGLIQTVLVSRAGAVAGVVVGALIFGAAHGQPLQFPALFTFGLVLGWLAYRYRRLGPAIAAHVAFNSLTLVELALLG